MRHFTKHFKKKVWYHLVLPLSSAFITVAVLDMIACCSWLFKDYGIVHRYSGEEDMESTTISLVDIFYWIFVTYRVVLSLLLCIGGIFMGRRLVVIMWLTISIMVDMIHLSETIFVLSKPHLVKTWPIFMAVASSIWGEMKIIRIKYRIIRRTFTVDWNTTDTSKQMETESAVDECNCDKPSISKIDYNSDVSVSSISCSASGEEFKLENTNDGFCMQTNIINFVKLARNLYNLLTWHLTGFLFGGDFHKLISKNYKAVFLEEKFIRYARIFLDALTIVYILQEKKLLVTPWITLYILCGSAVVAIALFVLLHLNLMTSLFVAIYYLVFSIDLFFRAGFIIFCVKLIVRRKELI